MGFKVIIDPDCPAGMFYFVNSKMIEPKRYYCEGCNEKTLVFMEEKCPECGTENELDHMKPGWDNKQ